MTRLGITSMSYPQYLKHRREGGTPSSACYALRNRPWLLSQVSDCRKSERLQQLIAAHDKARDATQAAFTQIVRRRI